MAKSLYSYQWNTTHERTARSLPSFTRSFEHFTTRLIRLSRTRTTRHGLENDRCEDNDVSKQGRVSNGVSALLLQSFIVSALSFISNSLFRSHISRAFLPRHFALYTSAMIGTDFSSSNKASFKQERIMTIPHVYHKYGFFLFMLLSILWFIYLDFLISFLLFSICSLFTTP